MWYYLVGKLKKNFKSKHKGHQKKRFQPIVSVVDTGHPKDRWTKSCDQKVMEKWWSNKEILTQPQVVIFFKKTHENVHKIMYGF